jgi:hypothetical protein
MEAVSASDMTGIVIFTAGRQDAYEDYQRSVKEGHRLAEIKPYLPEKALEELEVASDDDHVHLWGTSVADKWQNVDPGDIALVYHDGQFVARGQVLFLNQNHSLATHLWKESVDHDRWDPENPWEYLTFLTEVEEIDVDIEDFNRLVGYDNTYRPQGFTRVADKRISELTDEYDSVETALADLTDAGKKIHKVDIEDNGPIGELIEQLSAASVDGSRAGEFEQLVAKAFVRLGCTTNWVEGGGDTDVEILSPSHVVVEAKTRSSGTLNTLEATNVDKHRRQRGADHAIVVAPGFSPKVIENAKTNELTTLSVDDLGELLSRREQYAVPPEQTFELLTRPGAFQDDRLDMLDEQIQNRLSAGETLLDVISALEHANEPVATAGNLRLIVIGMQEPDNAPSEADITEALHLLRHPSLGVVKQTDEGYQLVTSQSNAIQLLQSLTNIVREV